MLWGNSGQARSVHIGSLPKARPFLVQRDANVPNLRVYCPRAPLRTLGLHALQSTRQTMTRHPRPLQGFSRSIALFLLLGCAVALAQTQTKQEHVHHSGHGVMPFDLAKTTHIFRMTDSGGVQRVIVKDPAAKDQVALIQRHLQHEAAAFQRGDYSDPASLHGADMPGLKDLQAGAAQIRVSYSALPTGAEIIFETTDLHLLTAIHRWFGAQLSEHGADATSE